MNLIIIDIIVDPNTLKYEKIFDVIRVEDVKKEKIKENLFKLALELRKKLMQQAILHIHCQ